ncbi:MAG TPA: chemotaxis protein CheW [Gemmatimonadaceae bacterium]|nr:chemotaxis protein CheW [Gemmatimonadaceae bacterium]
MTVDILTFQVGRHRYALNVADVHAVLRATSIVPLPRAPSVIQGVIDYRGEIIPVFDLRARFGAPRRPVQVDEHFVMVRARSRLVALRMDSAIDVAQIDERSVQPIGDVVPRTEYVAGLASLPDGIVLIVDAHDFLSESETALLDEAMTASANELPALAPE